MAILLVLVMHSFGIGAVVREGPAWKIPAAGWIGVDLFFVISGYLITGILLATRGKRGYLRVFFSRRFLRIFPPYYLVLATILLLGLAIPALDTPAFQSLYRHQFWLWTYTVNVKIGITQWPFYFGWFQEGAWFTTAHFWSLAVEEQYYLVWPVILAFAPGRRVLWAMVAICLAAPILRVYFLLDDNPWAAYMLTPCRMDALSFGGIVAVVQSEGRLERLGRVSRIATPILIVATVSLGIVRGNFSNLDFAIASLGYSLVALTFASFLVYILTTDRMALLNRFFASAPMRFLGKYSYTVYIVHTIVASAGLHIALTEPGYAEELAGSLIAWLLGVFIFTVCVSYALAIVIWHLFEKRFLALKRYVPYPTDDHRSVRPVPSTG